MPRFDLPIYCAAWAEPAAGDDESEVVVLAGGGGNGIANKIFLSRYDWQTEELSEELQSVSTGDDVPYRMTLHPGGEGSIVCSSSTNCTTLNLRYFTPKGGQLGWNLEPAEESLASLSDAGQQCVVFSADGSRLAAGGEDGHLRVFEWPSLQPILDKAGAHLRIKDVDFSLDATFLASTDDGSPCRIWDLVKAAPIATLDGDKVVFARFSRGTTKSLLYAVMRGGRKKSASCTVATWDTTTWTKRQTRAFSGSGITSFSISEEGNFLAIGGLEGDISVVDTRRMVVCQRVKDAHSFIVTAMAFSPKGRALLSVAADGTARVSLVDARRKDSRGYMVFILFFLVSLLVLYIFTEENMVPRWKERIVSLHHSN